MYRKNEELGSGGGGRGWVGLGRVGFWSKLQNSKKFHQVLDFQRFAVLDSLWSGFGVALE
jgi:hypothetical protein